MSDEATNQNGPAGEASAEAAAEQGAGGAAVAAPARREAPKQPKPLDLFHVVLHDDDDHTYEYVMRMMQQLFACDAETAYERAKIVDAEGRVICATTHKELAELKRDQIHAFGKDRLISSCKGSMSASIEPAGR
jgi:ATP-dependent Clp protease adaptor protein ClpS